MNDKWLRSFMMVAQKGSVNAAAKELFISPQALLQQINLLEQEVGISLVIRRKSGVELTLSGKEFLNGAQQILLLYDRTLNRCRLVSEAENTIRIPVMSGIILPRFLENVCAEFRKSNHHPKIELISDENFDFWLDGLKNLKYDIIEHFAVDGMCPHDIHFEYLSPQKTWCILPDFHPLAQKSSLIPEDLDGFRIMAPGLNLKLMRYLQFYLEAAGIEVVFENIENNRYQIIENMNMGGIYMADEEISKIFVGYSRVPLDFDNHVQHGLACRKEMYEEYRPFFDIAHKVNTIMEEQRKA